MGHTLSTLRRARAQCRPRTAHALGESTLLVVREVSDQSMSAYAAPTPAPNTARTERMMRSERTQSHSQS